MRSPNACLGDLVLHLNPVQGVPNILNLLSPKCINWVFSIDTHVQCTGKTWFQEKPIPLHHVCALVSISSLSIDIHTKIRHVERNVQTLVGRMYGDYGWGNHFSSLGAEDLGICFYNV